MEPLVGYGKTHRFIFPESHFRTAPGSDFALLGMVLYENWCSPPARFDDAQPPPQFLLSRSDQVSAWSGS
jgi:hypothetical protein